MYYRCGENKGADQLCSYCTADLHICFCTDKNPVSNDVAQMCLFLPTNENVRLFQPIAIQMKS